MTAGALEHQDDEAVVKLLSETIPLFEASDNEEIKATLEESNLAGMTRRLSLMGNPMEITGTLLGGEEVDWESYRGKVVLVDFWATWCGPCRAEVPNILAMHKAYGAKGFDVLGVSLDETAEDAETYIEEQGIPWKSLFSDKEEERGWANPLARYYGINGIPTAILVDQEGKVVDMNARGERLQQRLQELLGDPVEAPADEAAEEPAEDAAASEEADADAAS
jgi:thiol-disulfide isomerase/thioredoxin